MDAASILVLVLTAGGVVLLVWFELNSRRNAAQTKTQSSVQANPDTLKSEKPITHTATQKPG